MRITGDTRVFAVIGDPVGHSLSPLMQNGWIEDQELDAIYVALPLRSADPASAIHALGDFGVAGANVTVPYKEVAARAAARAEGPVANVLRWERDGSLSAFNTDGPGFLDSLDEAVSGWRGRVRSVLMLGAGGAAQAIGSALSPYVDRVCFTNRTASRAENAASRIQNADIAPWAGLSAAFSAADLIVQATSSGMPGQDAVDWPIEACRAGTIAADVVYRPMETDFLRAARARDLVAVDGLGMLIHQGARAFEIWFGIRPDASKARTRLQAALR